MTSANNTLVGAIRVEASLDAGKFIDGARKVQKETKQTEQTIKQSFSGLGATIKAGIAGFAGALSVGLFTAGVRQALEYASGLKTVSQQLGITTKDLQELRYAAAQTGVGPQQLEQGLERLNTSLGKAAGGSKQARAAFAAVGVSLDDIANKTNRQIFEQIADAMQKQGGAAKNAAAGNAIFGEGFAKMIPLLAQGSAGIDGLAAAAEELGIVLSDEQIANADQTAKKLEAVKTVLEARIAGVVADNADAILALADALASIVGAAASAIRAMQNFYSVVSNGVGAARSAAPTAFEAATRTMNALLPGSGSLLNAFGGSGSGGSARNPGGSLGSFAGSLYGGGRVIADIPSKGRSSRSRRGARPPRDRSDDVEAQVARELLQADLDILRAKQQVATDYVERTSLSIQMLDIEKQLFELAQNEKVRKAQEDLNEGRITEQAFEQVRLGAEALKSKNSQVDALKRQEVLDEEQAQRLEDVARLTGVSIDIQEDALRDQLALVTTARQRREIELRLLDLARQREQAAIDELAASKDAADQEEARRRQVALNASLPGRRQQVLNATRGPLEEWATTVPQTADEIIEAFQRIEVQGIEGIADAIGEVIQGTKSLKDAFGDAAQSIIQAIIQMTIRMLIFRTLTAAFGGLFGGSVSAGSLGGSLAGSAAGLPAMAGGGSFRIGGNGGVDNNVLSLNGLPVARVSQGENVRVSPAGDGAVPQHIVLHLNDPLLEARIAEGADVRIVRAYPSIQAGVVSTIDQRQRRR